MFRVQTLFRAGIETGGDATQQLDLSVLSFLVATDDLASVLHKGVHGADISEPLKTFKKGEVAAEIELESIDVVTG